MKSFLILILLFNLSCIKDGPSTDEGQVAQPVHSDATGATSGGTNPSLTKTGQFMELINNHRISIGLQALVHDEELADIATIHSVNMATGVTSFGHDGFSNRCAEGRLMLGGGDLCGENVAMGQKNVNAAFTAWMNSPGHRSNIEQPRVTHSGFGYAQNTNETYYWTQIFIEKN
jgi:uncharacterized protein YkwD